MPLKKSFKLRRQGTCYERTPNECIFGCDFRVFAIEVLSELIIVFWYPLKVGTIRAHCSVFVFAFKVMFESFLLPETGMTDVALE